MPILPLLDLNSEALKLSVKWGPLQPYSALHAYSAWETTPGHRGSRLRSGTVQVFYSRKDGQPHRTAHLGTASVSKYLSGQAKNFKGKIKYELPHQEGRDGTKETNYKVLKTKQGKERKGDLCLPGAQDSPLLPLRGWTTSVDSFWFTHMLTENLKFNWERNPTIDLQMEVEMFKRKDRTSQGHWYSLMFADV